MDDFQFIMESPQNNLGHKKRPRLVTSCDNCRMKKIKCLQSTSDPKCEACKVSKIPCRFRDRERYFAERSRAIAGPSASPSVSPDSSGSSSPVGGEHRSSSSSSYSARSSSHSPRASGVLSPENGVRYQSYPPDPHRRVDSPYAYANPTHYPYALPRSSPPTHSANTGDPLHFMRGPGDAMSIENRQNPPPIPLFDPEYAHIQRPHPRFMAHFIQLFFDQMGSQCPFLNYNDIFAKLVDQTLSPLLANCIAALAVRYSDLPELTARGVQNIAETYGNNAKTIMSSLVHISSLETLHALMLLSWSEYKSNRVSGFRGYVQMAMRMALDLGLSDDSTIQLTPSEHERSALRVTWTSLVQLHFFASSCKTQWSSEAGTLTDGLYLCI